MVVNAPAVPAKPFSPSGVISKILSTSRTYFGLRTAAIQVNTVALSSEFIDPPRYRVLSLRNRRSA